MATKRFKGLPDKGVGELLTWVIDKDPKFPDGGYYETSDTVRKDQTKVRIPRQLIDYLRDQLVNRGHLTATQSKSLPNNKVVLFYLFDAMENQGWADEFKKAFDNTRDMPFHAVMKADANLKAHDKYADKSERELLGEILDGVHNSETMAQQYNRRRMLEHYESTSMLHGLLRSSSWLIAQRTAMPPFNSVNFTGKIVSDFPRGFAENLNPDRLTIMSDIIMKLGQDDISRLNKAKRK